MHLIFESFRQYSCDPSSISCSCTGLFTVGTHTHMHITYIIYYVVVPNNARVVNDRGYIHVSIMQVAGRRGQDPPTPIPKIEWMGKHVLETLYTTWALPCWQLPQPIWIFFVWLQFWIFAFCVKISSNTPLHCTRDAPAREWVQDDEEKVIKRSRVQQSLAREADDGVCKMFFFFHW